MSRKLIDIRNLSVYYDGLCALQDVNLEIFSDDFIGIIGPNGGGKTTLVKAILGLVKTGRGKITSSFNNTQTSGIGYLPQVQQIDHKFPISVREVVRSGLAEGRKLMMQGRLKSRHKVEATLEEMGIIGLIDKPIGSLSGGERQRVMLARAIVSEPELLILDEPSSFVDQKFERDLYEKLRQLNNKMAVMLVSHDVGTISYYIKSIACVNKKLHYHKSNVITEDQLAAYDCPIQIITHGRLPHTVLKEHDAENT